MSRVVSKIMGVLGSRRFYWLVLGFFVFEALWIALSAVYPMAFDEDFHLGVIRIYSQHWSPFLAGQPESGNQFGALAVDPSYLYHYLMSFPYRFMSIFTDSQTAHVIALRLCNVAMMTVGVMLFRRVLLRAGTSQALTNTAMLLFALIPTVPLLAGQINYDNLMLLALAGVCWVVLDITEVLRVRKLNLRSMALLAVLLMLSCLVKYSFLPIAIATVAYVVYMLWRTFRGRRFWPIVAKSYAALARRVALAMLALLVVATGLFMQRYGQNLVAYHNPVPDCGVVLDLETCMEYGPWGRNYRYAASRPANFTPEPLAYVWTWLQGLHYRMFFVITGPPEHTNYPPALFPSATAVVIGVFSLAALLFFWRRIFAGQPYLVFLLVITALYAASLFFLSNYPQYVETGQPVAINGRYFVPFLLPMAVVIGRALSVALHSRTAKTWIAVGAIALFLQGGGVFSFILRSDAAWYWPNQVVTSVNQTAQSMLSKIMFIGPKKYDL